MRLILIFMAFSVFFCSCKKDILEIKQITPNPNDSTLIPSHKCQSHEVFINVDSLITNYIPIPQNIKTVTVCDCDTIKILPFNYYTDSIDIQFDIFTDNSWTFYLNDSIEIYESSQLQMDAYIYDTLFVSGFYAEFLYNFVFEDCE